MKIQTYILVPKKKMTVDEALERLVEIIYQTIIPLVGAYGFFKTQSLIFFIPMVLPIFIRFKLEQITTKVYPKTLNEFSKAIKKDREDNK